MLVSTLTSNLSRRFTMEKALKIIKDAGFDAYDITLTDLVGDEFPFELRDSKNYVEVAKNLRAYADSLGLVCNQSHGPVVNCNGDPKHDQDFFDATVKSLEISSILGAKIVVVHPKQHLHYSIGNNPQILRDVNIKFYSDLVPFCEKYNIKVAVENMWQYDPIEEKYVVDSTCSRPEEFCDYIDSVNSEWIVACLDIGHVTIVGQDLPNMIKALGHRLQALHVHDNDLKGDLHLTPFEGNIDFDKVCAALKEIGYTGDITFETNEGYKIPYELQNTAHRHLCEIGKYLKSKIID